MVHRHVWGWLGDAVEVSSARVVGEDILWRASLLAFECAALTEFWGRCATQREQARSPQKLMVVHGFVAAGSLPGLCRLLDLTP